MTALRVVAVLELAIAAILVVLAMLANADMWPIRWEGVIYDVSSATLFANAVFKMMAIVALGAGAVLLTSRPRWCRARLGVVGLWTVLAGAVPFFMLSGQLLWLLTPAGIPRTMPEYREPGLLDMILSNLPFLAAACVAGGWACWFASLVMARRD